MRSVTANKDPFTLYCPTTERGDVWIWEAKDKAHAHNQPPQHSTSQQFQQSQGISAQWEEGAGVLASGRGEDRERDTAAGSFGGGGGGGPLGSSWGAGGGGNGGGSVGGRGGMTLAAAALARRPSVVGGRSGQGGAGGANGSAAAPIVPTRVPGIKRAVAVAVGDKHRWGKGSCRQCGEVFGTTAVERQC